MAKKKSDIKPGGVESYIAKCPKDAQVILKNMRAAIQQVAPDAVETVSYFQMPGYFYAGDYAYNGMFVWFSFSAKGGSTSGGKKPYVRLHVWPPVIKNYKNELAGYPTTTAIVSFPADEKLPVALIKKLVRASLKAMKDESKK